MEIFRPDISFDFIGKRKTFVGASCVAVLLSLLLLATKGINKGIDFTGGTLVQIQFNETKPIGEVRSAISSLSLGDTVVQEFGSDREFLIRVEKSLGSTQGVGERVESALAKRFGKGSFERRRTESVGPKVGKDLREKAFSSMIFALLGILAYVSIRFQFRQAIASVIALLHDVIITMGVFAISGKEFSLPIVAAILTIIGYSLNDTIVVFDRIREVRGKNPALTDDMVNTSLNQTLARTILTSLTTFMVVAILYAIGGEGIHGFAFCLVLGVIVGTYSSIYVASPVLLWLMNRGDSKTTKTRAAA